MQKRIRQVFTSLREHTFVSYAKIATISGFCDIDLTIVKATSPDDLPLLDKHVHEFLKIFSICPSSYRAFALSFTRRFDKTKSWRVALKCLVLLHRLLRSLSDNSSLRAELLWARSNGLFSLYPCNFRDRSSSDSEDYTTFIKSYAHVLDEALDCASFEMEELETPCLDTRSLSHKMKDVGRIIEILPQFQSLIDCIMECWPTGAATRNFLVKSVMKHIIRDSFTYYTTFRREIVMVLDNLIQIPYRSCVAAFNIYKIASIQLDQLSEFHEWCKSMGYCGYYEYPFIDRIPEIHIQALEIFLNGMWQLTDQSSSSNISTLTSNVQSPLSLTDDDRDSKIIQPKTKIDQVNKDVEIEPLIQWEVDSKSLDWEDLLEASISTTSCMDSRTNKPYENNLDEANGWKLQVHNPYAFQTPNPYYNQPHKTNFYYGSCPSTPMHILDH